MNSSRRVMLIVLLSLIVAGALTAYLSIPDANLANPEFWRNYLQNISSEIVGAVITFVLFELLLERRERIELQRITESQELAELINQVRSQDNATALSAVHKLRSKGWLQNGKLKGTNLEGAALWEADLSDAQLENAILSNVSLAGCNLSNTNLSGASLFGTTLAGAYLEGARIVNAEFDLRTVLPDAIPTGRDERNWQIYDKYFSGNIDMRRYTDRNHKDVHGNSDFWLPEWAASGFTTYGEWFRAGKPKPRQLK